MKNFANSLLLSAAILALTSCAQAELEKSSSPSSSPNSTTISSQDSGKTDLPELAEYLEHDIFTLDNGLSVIVHEDRSAPKVELMVVVHVGSKDEPIGKSGFAHLFEHVLFRGTEKNPGDIFSHLRELGATGMNGTTSTDVTTYYETVPTGALERALWLESDRIENVYKTVDEEVLKTEIEIVKNEKAGSESEPFSGFHNDTLRALFPLGHPHSHNIIGSIEDLDAASIKDVKDWYLKYYGARNTTLTLSGDVDLATAKELVTKYFSHIPTGPALLRHERAHTKRLVNTVQHIHDSAPTSSISRTYVLPPDGDKRGHLIKVATELFGNDTYSRLHQDLVEDWKVATKVDSGSANNEIVNQFIILADAAEGVSLEDLSAAIDKSLEKYFDEGPAQSHLDSYYGSVRGQLTYGLENTSAKSDVLTFGYVLHDDPYFSLRTLEWTKNAKLSDLKKLAKEYLSTGYHEVHNVASDEFKPVAATVDLDVKPPIKPVASSKIPEPEIFTLDNGLEIVFLRQSRTPRVQFEYITQVGIRDLPEDQKLTARGLGLMLNRSGIPGLSREEQSLKLDTLEAGLQVRVSDLGSSVVLFSSSESLDKSFEVFSNVIKSGEINEKDFADFKEKSLEDIEKQKESPISIAEDIFSLALDGDDYFTTIDERLAGYKSMTPEGLREVRDLMFRPGGARMFVVGDITSDKLKSMLEKEFGSWSGQLPPQLKDVMVPPAQLKRPKFILVEDKDAVQTTIGFSRHIRPLTAGEVKNKHAENIMNEIFGGGYSSRLNSNIREENGYTYSIRSNYRPSRGRETFTTFTDVTADKAVETIEELYKEMNGILTTNPISQEDMDSQIDVNIRKLSLAYDRNISIISAYAKGMRVYGAWDALDKEEEKLRALTLDDMSKAAKKLINPNDLLWVVVGDLDNFEDRLRAKNLGDIEVYDGQGNRLR